MLLSFPKTGPVKPFTQKRIVYDTRFSFLLHVLVYLLDDTKYKASHTKNHYLRCPEKITEFHENKPFNKSIVANENDGEREMDISRSAWR